MNTEIKRFASKARTSQEIWVTLNINRSTYYRRLSKIRDGLGDRLGHFWTPAQVQEIIEHVSPDFYTKRTVSLN